MEKKLSEQERDLLLFIIKIIKSLEDLGVLIEGLTETLNNQIKQEGRFLPALRASLAASLVQPIISSVVKGISGISGRRGRRAGRRYMNKTFSSASFFKQYRDYYLFHL